MSGIAVQFAIDDPADERWFLCEYLAGAWPRFESLGSFDGGWFWQFGPFTRRGVSEFDGEEVVVVAEADADELLESERDRWHDLEDEGRIESWNVRRYGEEGYDSVLNEQRDRYGETGGERIRDLKFATAPMSLELLSTFGGELPAVGESTPDNETPVGFWTLIHVAMVQNGYVWGEEIDACEKAIENRIRSLVHYDREAEAERRLDETIADLEAFREAFLREN